MTVSGKSKSMSVGNKCVGGAGGSDGAGGGGAGASVADIMATKLFVVTSAETKSASFGRGKTISVGGRTNSWRGPYSPGSSGVCNSG